MNFVSDWWGLILLLLIFLLKLFFDYENTVKQIRQLIFLAEEKARKEVLKTGEEEFEWVVENGYHYLPLTMKFFISEELFAKLVQYIFDQIKSWAVNRQLE